MKIWSRHMKDRTGYNYIVYWMVSNCVAALVFFNYIYLSVFSIRYLVSEFPFPITRLISKIIWMCSLAWSSGFLSLFLSYFIFIFIFIFNISVVKDQLSMQPKCWEAVTLNLTPIVIWQPAHWGVEFSNYNN